MAVNLVSVSIPPERVLEIDRTLDGIKKGAVRAITVAVNKTANTGRSRIVKRLAKIINLKQGRADGSEKGTLNRYIRVRKANFDTLEAYIRLTREGIPLTFFDPKPDRPGEQGNKGGVSVKTRKGKGREVLTGTFVAQMRSGHVGVFERARTITHSSLSESDRLAYNAGFLHFRKSRLVTRGMNTRVPRLPIEHRYGPTPLGVFEHAPGVAAEELAALGPILDKNLDSQVQRLLAGKKPDESTSAAE